jgi:hypothetical protein
MPSTSRQRMLLAGAAIVLLAGFVTNWVTGRDGVDFPSLYVTGRGLIDRVNIYGPGITEVFPERYGVAQPQGMFYPPATAFSMLPFAALPYALGKFVWHSTIVLTLIFGIRSLVRFAMPRAGNHVWMFCAGIVLLSSALRWGMMLLQGAPLVLGMLCFFIAAANGNRPKLAAALAILAVAVKMTLALPFLGILLLRRRLLPVIAAGATWAALNALGFAIMGHGAFASYRANVGDLESFGNINAPDPWNPLSLPRLDWTTLVYGVTGNLSLARAASLALTAAVALWLLREGLRTRDPLSAQSTALFLPPLVCLGSLCVYHHQYDAALFFAPALLGALVLGPELRPRWAVYLTLPLIAMLLLLPIGLAQRIAENMLGLTGVGLLKLTFPVAFNLALIGSLVALSRSRSEAVDRETASAS